MITLTSYPQGDADSHYYAVANPLLYKFNASGRGAGAYNTYDFDSLSATGSIFNVTPAQASVMNVGDIIMINSTVITNVTKIVASEANPTQITVSPAHNISAGSLNIVSINNYRIEFRVFHGRKEQDGLGNQIMVQVGPIVEATPDITGAVEFNVQPYLRPFVDPVFELSANKNTTEVKNWGRFFIQYRERYEGDGKEPEDAWQPNLSTPNRRYYVAAVRQLQTGGVTLHPYNIYDTLAELKGQFLTPFIEPDYIIGSTSTANELSFIWPNDTNVANLRVKEEPLNSNKQPTGFNYTALQTTGIEEVNRVRLEQVDSPYFRVTIETDPGATEAYVQPGYVLEGYFELI